MLSRPSQVELQFSCEGPGTPRRAGPRGDALCTVLRRAGERPRGGTAHACAAPCCAALRWLPAPPAEIPPLLSFLLLWHLFLVFWELAFLNRVVIRTSVGWAPPVKGCTETSSRPLSRLKPRATAILWQSAACQGGGGGGGGARGEGGRGRIGVQGGGGRCNLLL